METVPWFDGQPSCTGAPFDVSREFARRHGLMEARRRCSAERPMASGTLAPLEVALTAVGQAALKADGMWHLALRSGEQAAEGQTANLSGKK